MKRTTRLTVLVAAAVLAGLAIPRPVVGQVEVIRQPPQSGAKQGTASWSEAYPEPAAVRQSGEPRLTGRVSVGGQGGQSPAGEALYDVATDSRVTLVQPLGQSGILSVDAAALRSRSATDQNQDYGGRLSLDFERLQFDAAGGYRQSSRPIENVDKEDADAYLSASLSSGLVETLPMSLRYKSSWTERGDDALQTESARSDELFFRAAGTVGRVGLEIGATLENEEDRLEQSGSLGTAGDLKITVPFGERFAVQARGIPNFNRSESAASSLSSTSLESGLGILWTVIDDLQTRLVGSRVDAWSQGSGIPYEPYQATWKGELGLEYEPPAGLFAGPAYGLAKTSGGNFTHDIRLPLGWRRSEGAVREISGSGTAILTRSQAGARVRDAVDWGLAVAMVPVARMSLSGNYLGGLVWEAGTGTWNHKMQTSFMHSPDPLLDYRAAVSLSNNQEEESEGLWKHQYQAGFTLKPQWNLKVYAVDLSETLAVSNGPAGDDALSSAALTVSIPISSGVTTRCGAQWEWINRRAPGEGPGNNFRYVAAVSAGGQGIPFSFEAEYAFAHGYRGIRHDVRSGLQIPLPREFALEGVFTLSSYDEEGRASLPFLLGLNLVYEF